MSADSDLPRVFSKKAVPFWIAGFVATCVMLQYFADILRPSSTEEAAGLILTNIEILVTMLTVTLGVTLLGLQFRAQSYTMMALIRYIRDRVVYGFISVFAVLIVFSMSVMIIPWMDPVEAAPFAFAGTSFSIVYLIGYVYYMVHEIQPTQVMAHLKARIDGIKASEMVSDIATGREKGSGWIELFVVWEQIMLRAVEADNFYVYRTGLDAVFSKLNDCLEIRDGDIRDPVYAFFFQYLSAVTLAGVRENRDRFVRITMDTFKTIDEEIPESHDQFNSRRMMAFHMWQHVMRESMRIGNVRMSRYGMLVMRQLLDRYLKRNRRDAGHVLTFFHMHMARAVDAAIASHNTGYLFDYLKILGEMVFPERRAADEPTPLEAWVMVMKHAVRTDRIGMFEYGAGRLFSAFGSAELGMDAIKHMHRAVDAVVAECGSDERCVRVLMDAYRKLLPERRPTRAWECIMYDSVGSSNDVIFDLCVTAIRDTLSDSDAGFFAEFACEMKNNSRLGVRMSPERLRGLATRIDMCLRKAGAPPG